MKYLPRICMAVAVLFVLSLFKFPMWRITLFAPQYPDGVTMYIWVNKIGGDTPGTLQNINILNHYIGMKYIEPDDIPELKYFPWIVGVMAALGIIAIYLNKGWMYFGWGLIMIILAAAGIYDFYLWEYDYGHNLSDKAPIKIPEASFQPPLIGTKQIINFTAASFPHTSGILTGIGILLSFIGWYITFRLQRHVQKNNSSFRNHGSHLLRTFA